MDQHSSNPCFSKLTVLHFPTLRTKLLRITYFYNLNSVFPAIVSLFSSHMFTTTLDLLFPKHMNFMPPYCHSCCLPKILFIWCILGKYYFLILMFQLCLQICVISLKPSYSRKRKHPLIVFFSSTFLNVKIALITVLFICLVI